MTVDMASLVPVNPVNLSPGLANGGVGNLLVYIHVYVGSQSHFISLLAYHTGSSRKQHGVP